MLYVLSGHDKRATRYREESFKTIDDGTSGGETGDSTNRIPARWTGMWREEKRGAVMDSNLTLCERSNHGLHSRETDRSVGEIQELKKKKKSQRIGFGGTLVMCNIQGVTRIQEPWNKAEQDSMVFEYQNAKIVNHPVRFHEGWISKWMSVEGWLDGNRKCSDGRVSMKWRNGETKSGKWS